MRLFFSGFPCGNLLRCDAFAETKSMALPFLHDATHAPQPIHAAASKASSASFLSMGIELASGAEPVRTSMYPPAAMMRSNALRSTMRSLTTGNAFARNGSIQMVSPSLNLRMWSWHVVMPVSLL